MLLFTAQWRQGMPANKENKILQPMKDGLFRIEFYLPKLYFETKKKTKQKN